MLGFNMNAFKKQKGKNSNDSGEDEALSHSVFNNSGKNPERVGGFPRRKFIVDRRFQLELILCLVCVLGITLGCLYFGISKAMDQLKDQLALNGSVQSALYSGFLLQQRSLINKMFFWGAMGAIGFIVLGGLVLSHRIAGPLYRLGVHMKSIALGEAPRRVKFRGNDYFCDLADVFNEMIDKLNR